MQQLNFATRGRQFDTEYTYGKFHDCYHPFDNDAMVLGHHRQEVSDDAQSSWIANHCYSLSNDALYLDVPIVAIC